MVDVRTLGVALEYRKIPPQRKQEPHDSGPDDFSSVNLEIGSDAELANKVIEGLNAEFEEAFFCEDQFYVWKGTHWTILDRNDLLKRITAYDGTTYPSSDDKDSTIRLSIYRIRSIAEIASALIAQPDFFRDPPLGINCASGFITFGEDGRPSIAAHAREHRQRHVLPGRWDETDEPLPTGSLLSRLLTGCFLGDKDAQEKASIIAEIAGAAALGIGTRLRAPKAIILFGPSAGNGKSQVLELFRALLPSSAIASISPRMFSDPRFMIHLAGKLLNATDELGGAAILSDDFKAVITGDTVTAREIYRTAYEFKPNALNVFATNKFPTFQDGMDPGVRRRLLPIVFNRTIPEAERIEAIGRKIGAEEPDLLLGWAVAGAARLVARGMFPSLTSSQEALSDWIMLTDPIGAWLADSDAVQITGADRDIVHSRAAYAQFRKWAELEGITPARIPIKGQFTQAVGASGRKGLVVKRWKNGTVFRGMRLRWGADQVTPK